MGWSTQEQQGTVGVENSRSPSRRSEHRAEHAFRSSSVLHLRFTTAKSEFSVCEALCAVDVGLIELCIY